MLATLELGLEPRLSTKVGLLSGGQRQAVTLLMATLMITHSMNDTIKYGNRIIMMHEGNIVVDVRGEEKRG